MPTSKNYLNSVALGGEPPTTDRHEMASRGLERARGSLEVHSRFRLFERSEAEACGPEAHILG